jgi:RDD family
MVAAPPIVKVYPFRRFLARLLDTVIAELLVLWGLILWYGLGRSAGLVALIGGGVFALAADAAFLMLDLSSPGKWLFSIRIHPLGDPKMGFWRALDRGFTAFTIGAGCYLPFVGWYALIQSYRALTETGSTTWDRRKFDVVHGALCWRRFLIAGAAASALLVIMIVTIAMNENRR